MYSNYVKIRSQEQNLEVSINYGEIKGGYLFKLWFFNMKEFKYRND